jgi:hypothetical protein
MFSFAAVTSACLSTVSQPSANVNVARWERTSDMLGVMWRSSRMRFVLTMLGLGLATTIAVAWACAWFMPSALTGDRIEFSHRESPRWRMHTSDYLGLLSVSSLIEANPAPADDVITYWWSRVRHQPPLGSKWPSASHTVEVAAGWPWPALMWKADWVQTVWTGTLRAPTLENIRWGLALYGSPTIFSTNHVVAHVLPMRPLVRGLVANALLFAAAWAVLILGLRSRRRLRRARHGFCARCRYDLRSQQNKRCPECGESNIEEALRSEHRIVAVTRVLFAIAAGAVTTIAVAWACAAWVQFDESRLRKAWLTEIPSLWFVLRLDAFGSTRVAWLVDDETESVLQREAHTRERAERPSLDPAFLQREQRRLQERRDERVAAQQMAASVDPTLVPDSVPANVPTSHRQRPAGSFVRDTRGWPLPARSAATGSTSWDRQAADRRRSTAASRRWTRAAARRARRAATPDLPVAVSLCGPASSQ